MKTQNQSYEISSHAILSVGDVHFEVPSAKLPEVLKVIELLSSFTAVREDYIGSYIEEGHPLRDHSGYVMIMKEGRANIGLDIKPRVKMTAAEVREMREAFYERQRAAEAAAKTQPLVEGKK